MPGIHCEQDEINPEPNPGNRILGPISGLHSNGAKTFSNKDEAYSSGSLQASKRDITISSYSGTVTGEDERNKLCSSPAPLFFHHLQMALANTLERNSQCYEAQVLLTQDCLEELEWWNTNMSRWNGKTLLKQDIDLVIDSDASLEGWGAHCSDQRTGVPWSCQERMMHINCLELLAATLATKTFAKSKTAISILLRIDSTMTVAYINNLGGTASKELVLLTRDLWMWCLERNFHITAVHLPGVMNTIADTESRVMRDDQQSLWSTRSGLVCFQTICPVPTLLQLVARSIYTSNRYLPSGLGKHEVLCKSPLEPGGQGTDKSAGSANSASISRPCLEDDHGSQLYFTCS